MAGTPIDTAYVAIEPDLSRFESRTDRDVGAAMRQVETLVRGAAEAIDGYFAKTADQIGAQFEGAFKKLDTELAEVARVARESMTTVDRESDQAAAHIEKVAKSAQSAHSGMSTMLTTAVGFAAGNVAMSGFARVTAFTKDAVFGFNSQLQSANIAFTTMLGSGQKAQAFLTDLQNFAKTTPFQFPDLVASAQSMLGMGINAKAVIPDLTALGDAVASVGGGQEQIRQVTLAFEQMAAKGKLDMGNMEQLMQGGVANALSVLADKYHVTTGKMIEMISSGKVLSSTALPLLVQGLEQGTAHVAGLGGMMDKQSHTFAGALSNIQDSLQQSVAGAFRPFFDTVSTRAQQLATWLGSDHFSHFTAEVIGVARRIGDFFAPIIHIIVSIMAQLSPVLGTLGTTFSFIDRHKTIFQAIAVAVLAVVAAMQVWKVITAAVTAVQIALDVALNANPIGLIILAIVALVAAFAYLWTHSAAFRNFWIGLWNDIWGFLKAVGAWFAGPFANFFVNAWRFIVNAFEKARDTVMRIFHDINMVVLDFFQKMINGAATAFGWVPGLGDKLKTAQRQFEDFRDRVNVALGGIKDKTVDVRIRVNQTAASLAANPHGLAKGGIVRAQPGGQFILAGEGGEDEAVLSARRLETLVRGAVGTSGGGGSIGGGVHIGSVHLNFGGVPTAAQAYEAGRQVVAGIRDRLDDPSYLLARRPRTV